LKLRGDLRTPEVWEKPVYITSPQTVPNPHTKQIPIGKFQGYVSGMVFISCTLWPLIMTSSFSLLRPLFWFQPTFTRRRSSVNFP